MQTVTVGLFLELGHNPLPLKLICFLPSHGISYCHIMSYHNVIMSYHDLFKFPSKFIYSNIYFNGSLMSLCSFKYLSASLCEIYLFFFHSASPLVTSSSPYFSYQKLMILKICPVSVNSALFSLVLVSTCPLEYHHIILLFLCDEGP